MKNGFYRFTSERASYKTIAQHIEGEWYCINEVGPITLDELNRRGWDLDTRVKEMKNIIRARLTASVRLS